MNKYKILLLLLTIGCSGRSEKQPEKEVQNNKEIVTEISEDDPTYDELLKGYVSSYNEKILIDTIINKKLIINLEHYCLFDNGISIPEKYNWGEKKEVLLTHNFASKLIVLDDKNQILISRIIIKKVFEQLLSKDLQEYGVLLYPTFRGYNIDKNILRIHYSISIPLTDVGQSVIIDIDLDNNIIVNAD